jgi:hypothetical protein
LIRVDCRQSADDWRN